MTQYLTPFGTLIRRVSYARYERLGADGKWERIEGNDFWRDEFVTEGNWRPLRTNAKERTLRTEVTV